MILIIHERGGAVFSIFVFYLPRPEVLFPFSFHIVN